MALLTPSESFHAARLCLLRNLRLRVQCSHRFGASVRSLDQPSMRSIPRVERFAVSAGSHPAFQPSTGAIPSGECSVVSLLRKASDTMTYSMFLRALLEAEARRDDASLPQDVRDRSAETVALCYERMMDEGLSRQQLEELAAKER